jgi:hypothetical protein
LQPSALAFLQKSGIRLFTELIYWWEKERFQGKGNLQKLLKYFEEPVNAFSAARLFWPYDACSRLIKNKSVTWASLPLPLRELCILGILKLYKKKSILAFEISDFGASFFLDKQQKENISEPIVSNGSNFEWLISQNNGPYRVFQMLSFADLKNDEEPLRFTLNKESFLDGLRSGLPADYVKDFLSWNKAVQNVAFALNEWLRIYSDSSIETKQILRIKNPEKYEELSKHNPFKECIAENIPGWGFVIKPECEKKIRDILSHFSLEPAYNIATQNLEILQKLVEIEGFNLPRPVTNGGAKFD